MAKILVVDDDSEDLETMKDLLEADGHGVTPVTNGDEAMGALESEEFDVILIDILMPTLSGYDLLRLLKEKEECGSKLVYVSIVPKQEADMSDADGFIQKPFSTDGFMAEIKKALEK